MKTLQGAAWLVSARMVGRVIDFMTLLVLARALSPADFGLVAVAMTLIFVVEVVSELPLTQVLVRLDNIRKSHLDTAFTLAVLRILLFAFIIGSAAWPFAAVYDDDRLMPLLVALAVGPISRGLYSPGMVKFFRDINFWRGFVTEMSGKICGTALAILFVYLGAGYWAIAINGIASATLATAASYVLAPYRPAFSLKEWPEFANFISWFTVAQFVGALNWQFDRMLMGRFVSRTSLGQYTMANDLAVLPTQTFVAPAMTSVYAALSSVNSDRERLRNAYLKASRFTMMLAAPLCLGISLTSDLIINSLLDTKWVESAAYLEWLALTIVLVPYTQPLQSLVLAVSRADIIFWMNFINLCFNVTLISLGLYFGSIFGVIAARGAMSLIMFAASVAVARSLAGISVKSQFRSLREVAAACVVMTVAVMILRSYLSAINISVYIELVLTSVAGALVYGSVLHILGVRIIQVVEGIVRVKLPEVKG
ncbi:lipopolysaccharide biosynthesis protein [Microvirga tunisiensis]|nr:lipopolysaccharide biosynthesis protein [Microvirga tunisiensis]